MSNKIQNPNSWQNRCRKFLTARWTASDGGISEPKFQPSLLFKDVFVFVFLPTLSVVLFKTIESASTNQKPKRVQANYSARNDNFKNDLSKSQIIEFKKSASGKSYLYGRKTTGTLVKVKLLNVVETYANAPVHAQVMDISLGGDWLGSTLIGEATADSSIDRINMTFTLAKSSQLVTAQPIKGRALSLNGTLGVEAEKKEGFFARAALSSSQSQGNPDLDVGSDVKNILIRALASGLMQEASQSASVNHNRSQVLQLKSGEVFFVELTDNFPLKDIK